MTADRKYCPTNIFHASHAGKSRRISCEWLLSLLLYAAVGLVPGAARADATNATGATNASTATSPWRSDANLYDVQTLGSRTAYAVGEYGVVLRTADGGTSWQSCSLPVEATLRSVSFLTDRMGWVAGYRRQPFTGIAEGLLFVTADGGQSWQRLTGPPLPALEYVRFFSPDEGVVVGRATATAPSGIYRTADAGQTWTPVVADLPQHWLTAQFFEPQMGLVAGREGALSLIGGDQLLASQLPPLPSRAIRGLTILDNDSGWLVGDGGLVLTTSAGGVSWSAPPTDLPEQVRSAFDFQTVAAQGAHVWLAGSPGSVIWHSPDHGHTWERQLTGQTLPLSKLRMNADGHGLAVGEFGVILRTADGGRNWTTAQGQQRRAAWLAFIATPQSATLELNVKLTAEGGYRGVVWSASHPTAQPLAFQPDSRDLLTSAITTARGNVAGSSWKLPLDQPDLVHHGQALLANWQRRAENRAPMVLVEELARQLRTYRPDVVFLPHAPEQDAVAHLIAQAGKVAIQQAQDGTRALHLQELANLAPWTVKRVFQQLPAGSSGDVNLSPDEFLPHLSDSLHNQVRLARSVLDSSAPTTATMASIAFRRLDHDAATGAHVGGFFAGIDASPDSDTRRPLAAMDDAQLQAQQRLAQRQRNFRAVAVRAQQDDIQSAQLIGQLPEALRELSVEQAVVVLTDLGLSYRERSQFELAEATYLELIRRHPTHPAAADAMGWLLTYWSSGEVGWQRSRTRGQQVAQPRLDAEALQNRIVQAGGLGGSVLAAADEDRPIVPTANRVQQRDVRRRSSAGIPGAPPDHHDQWRKRALELMEQLQQTAPHLFEDPKVQLPLGALRRKANQPSLADQVYRRFPRGVGESSVSLFLERELWASQPITVPPRQLAACRRAGTRPYLDGVLSDECWQDAQETALSPAAFPGENATPSGLVMWAYDEEFLYVAAVLKAVSGRPVHTAALEDREYDARLVGFDRLGLALDVDRDYVSSYQWEIDERGQTAERCWEDASWNPKWYVARDADAERWQLEIAIPWSELAAQPPYPGDIWAASVVRTVPFTAFHGDAPTPSWPPQWHAFGLLKFE